MFSIEELTNEAKTYLPDLNVARLTNAFNYALKAHHDQYRFSGDPYSNHLLAVAKLLLPFKPDENTLIAAFMHDLSETPDYDIKDVIINFGDDVGTLVTGLERLNNLRLRSATSELESLRKMFLVMAGDLRVVLIRLADRLHNMQTLEFVQASKQKTIARETLDIYVPIALRLGMYRMKGQLEDACFRYLYPVQYNDLKAQLEDYLRKQEKVIDAIKVSISRFLSQHGIKARVEGRLKNLYSIYKKLKKKSRTTLNELFDIFAMRIVLPTNYNEQGVELSEHLYAVLGLIHSQWKPMGNRFKDYIAVPKANGYKSLHTVVTGLTPKPLNQPTEIQIRSERMQREADFGFASHWLYKEGQSAFPKRGKELKTPAPVFSKHDWFLELTRLRGRSPMDEGRSRPLKVEMFEDRIFVFTPTGDVKDLPKGSTPIDFAYAIHTDVGHRCCSAKVNGSIVPLDYQLKSGEVVDILTKNKLDPKPHWLSFVKTPLAKSKIKSYFRGFDSEMSREEGKKLLNKALQERSYPALDDNLSVLKRYGNKKLTLKDRRLLLEQIGNGSIALPLVMEKIFGSHLQVGHGHGKSKPSKKTSSGGAGSTTAGKAQSEEVHIYIAGEKDVPYRLSLCCKPVVGRPIVAYVTRGRAVKIHVQSCKLLKVVDQARTLYASWGPPQIQRRLYPVKIILKAHDRVGLIRDIADTVASFNLNIIDFYLVEKKADLISRQIVIEVADSQQLNNILQRLQQVRNVIEVIKADSSLL